MNHKNTVYRTVLLANFVPLRPDLDMEPDPTSEIIGSGSRPKTRSQKYCTVMKTNGDVYVNCKLKSIENV
jgi:hypothetical protein